MYNFPIGVLVESFRTDMKTGIKKAADLGVNGIQIMASKGEITPDKMTSAKTSEFKDLVASHGIIVSALCADFNKGFSIPENNPEFIEKTKRIFDLGKELGVDVITTHIGVVPPDNKHPRFAILQEACGELAEYAASMNSYFAIETGPETAVVLKGFMESLGSKGIAVNLDPANLVMVTGDDPVKAVHTLKDYIVHTHAKDGIKLLDSDPEIVYGVFEHENPTSKFFEEVPLGQGSVDFPAYLKALEDIGYRGFLTIEREVGANPEADITLAMDFLKDIISKN